MRQRMGSMPWGNLVTAVAMCMAFGCDDGGGGSGGGIGGAAGTSSGTGGASGGTFQASCEMPNIGCQDHYGWPPSALQSIKDSCVNDAKGTWNSTPCAGTYCGTCTFGNIATEGGTAQHYSNCDQNIQDACVQATGTWSN